MEFPEDIYEDEGFITEFGSLNLNEVLNEEEFGNDKVFNLGTLYFHVYPKEGNIPHFHVFNKDHKFETCIRFEVPEYFHHGKYNDEFNSKQIKEVNKWLHSNVPYSKLSNWEFGAIMWNQKNGKNKTIYINSIQVPNYRYIK